MKMNFWVVAGALALISGPAVAEMTMSSARYQCDRDVLVTATYLSDDHSNVAVVTADGWDQIVLVNVPAASGARYAAPEGDAVKDLWRAPYVWWTKGQEASLFHLDQDGTENLLLTCLQLP